MLHKDSHMRSSRNILSTLFVTSLAACSVPGENIEETGTAPEAYCYEEVAYPAAAGNNLWPGGVIPYVWDGANPPSATQKQAVLDMMAEYTAASADVVRFVPRGSETHYAKITAACGAGAVDRSWTVVQSNLGGCPGETMRHEMGHLVGLSHHAQRRDRDRYLIVAPGVAGGYGGAQCDPDSPDPQQHGVLTKASVARPFAWGGPERRRGLQLS